jgi:hypothetical protein
LRILWDERCRLTCRTASDIWEHLFIIAPVPTSSLSLRELDHRCSSATPSAAVVVLMSTRSARKMDFSRSLRIYERLEFTVSWTNQSNWLLRLLFQNTLLDVLAFLNSRRCRRPKVPANGVREREPSGSDSDDLQFPFPDFGINHLRPRYAFWRQ